MTEASLSIQFHALSKDDGDESEIVIACGGDHMLLAAGKAARDRSGIAGSLKRWGWRR